MNTTTTEHVAQVLQTQPRISSELEIRLAQLSPEKRELLMRRIARLQSEGRSKQIPRRGADRSVAVLSYEQTRLWFLERLNPGSSFYNVSIGLRLKGNLDLGLLEMSLNQVVRRHEAFRTRFVLVDHQPMQVIDRPQVVRLEPEQVASPEQLTRVCQEEGGRPFDLEHGPLFRVRVLRCSNHEHVVLFSMHHIVTDQWSTGVLVQEIKALYEAYAAGKSDPLPELPIQYADYAHWQKQYLSGEVLETHLAYWRRQLHGIEPLPLPTDRPRPATAGYRGDQWRFVLTQELSRGLRELSRKESVTLFMVMLAGFQAMLARCSGQEDVAVGAPIAGRGRTELEPLIGFFVNTLVLRTDLRQNPSFREILRRVREVTLAAQQHQETPFERIVEELHPVRDLSRNPLFQVGFAFQNAMPTAMELPGLVIEAVPVETKTTKFDLTLYIEDGGRRDAAMAGALEFSTEMFEIDTAKRMTNYFVRILESAVCNPEVRLWELPVLSIEEQRWLLAENNQTHRTFPAEKGVQQLFEEQARRTPQAEAVVYGSNRLSYGELNERANRLAHILERKGIGPETLVGICVDMSVEMIVALLGVLKAGAAYVPIDPEHPRARVLSILQCAKIALMLTQERLSERFNDAGVPILCLDTNESVWAEQSSHDPEPKADPDNLAYVIFTSGSTGTPKGVAIHHRALTNYVWWSRSEYRANQGQGVPVHSSLAFDLTITSIFTPLTAGQRIELLQPGGQWAHELAQMVSQNSGLTFIKLTPSHLAMIGECLSGADWKGGVGALVIGGEALPGEYLKSWRQHSPSTRLINEYGPTETVVGCCIYEADASTDLAHSIPIGRPIANVQLYILDKEGSAAPIGVAGEIYIGGVGVGRGYLGQARLTAEKFPPDPFSGAVGGRLYRTGDLGRWRKDGEIEFLGRLDQQVKIRGYRIELGEIETVLRESKTIRDAVVVAREWNGEKEKRLVAYVVAQPDVELNVEELKRPLKDRLPDCMLPAAFVQIDDVPLTVNGKLDHGALPDVDNRLVENAYQPPQTRTEQELTQIWEHVLQVPKIGIHGNFFEHGGHSLLLIRVQHEICSRFGKEIPIVTLFNRPTIFELAQLLDENDRERTEQQLGTQDDLAYVTEGKSRMQARRGLPAVD